MLGGEVIPKNLQFEDQLVANNDVRLEVVRQNPVVHQVTLWLEAMWHTGLLQLRGHQLVVQDLVQTRSQFPVTLHRQTNGSVTQPILDLLHGGGG